MGRFLERADGSTDGDSMDRYMSEVTEMFGEELFKLQQHAWDESKVELLIDNLHTAHRAWGDPLELPGSAPHGAPQPQQQSRHTYTGEMPANSEYTHPDKEGAKYGVPGWERGELKVKAEPQGVSYNPITRARSLYEKWTITTAIYMLEPWEAIILNTLCLALLWILVEATRTFSSFIYHGIVGWTTAAGTDAGSQEPKTLRGAVVMESQTHYVDPYNTVLRSVQRNVRVSFVEHERREKQAHREEAAADDDHILQELREEQSEIERRMRQLEDEERRLVHSARAYVPSDYPEATADLPSPRSLPAAPAPASSPPPPASGAGGGDVDRTLAFLQEDHAARMAEYDALLAAQEQRAASEMAYPPLRTTVGDTAPVGHEVELEVGGGGAAARQQFYTQGDYDDYRNVYQQRRGHGLSVKPFSFETRERLRKNTTSVRAEAKKRDEYIRQEKEHIEVMEPAGTREPFRATTVPPSTFTNRYELMRIEEEERRLKNRERAQLARDRKLQEAMQGGGRVSRGGYISEPLVQRERYVPVAERMAQYHFKARPVPRSVKEPKWDKIAESEILRKMDVKESARLKLAAYERTALRAARPASESSDVNRSYRSQSVPHVPEACVFKPTINKGVPDFARIREKETMQRVNKPAPKTTRAEEFKLSTPSYKEQFSVELDIQKDEAKRPENRWPYMLSRKPPARKSPVRSRSAAAPPTRYTKAANMALLKNSMLIVQREEKRKMEEEEDRRRQARQRTVSLTLKRYESGVPRAGELQEEEEAEEEQWKRNTRQWKATREQIESKVQKRKPIWLRQPEKQALEAASRAHAEAVSAQPADPKDDDSASEEEHKTPPSAPAAAEAAKDKDSGSGSDSDSDSYDED